MESLRQDIDVRGVLQPITLRRRDNDSYEVIIGSRRFAALQAARGPEGALNAGEYKIVEWSDDQCIQAAMSENKERADLAPVEEGRYYNNLARLIKADDGTVTDELLGEKTGVDRPRINDLRHLAESFDRLPESWQAQLSRPANCSSSDESAITVTHWKHLRSLVTDTIDKKVLRLMEKTAKKGWSCAKLKAELDALKAQEGIKAKSVRPVRERDPDADPDYPVVLKGLRAATVKLGRDDETANLINELIVMIEKRVKAQQQDDAADGDKKAEKAPKAKKAA